MYDNLNSILESARKKFGMEAAHILSSPTCIRVETIKTGVPQLDVALGVGGWPKGRIVETYGDESSGKTTLALHAIANVQKKGGTAAIIDAEHAIDPDWAEKIGVDKDGIIISQPESGEEALSLCELYANSGVNIIVVDSVAALTPRAELDGDMGDSHMGLQARMMGQAMRKLRGVIRKSGSLLIFTNQVRYKIGVVYGNPITTPGGNALKFYASVRVEMSGYSPKDEDKEGDNVVSKSIRMKVVKNKLAPPFKICIAKIGFENGFDLSKNLFDGLFACDLIEKQGNTYYLNDEKLAVGKNNAIKEFESMDQEKLDELYKDLVLKFNDEYQDLLDRKGQLISSIEKRKEKEKDYSDKESELKEVEDKIVEIRSH